MNPIVILTLISHLYEQVEQLSRVNQQLQAELAARATEGGA